MGSASRLALAGLVLSVVASRLQAQNPEPVAVQLPTGDYVVLVEPADSFPAQLAGTWHIVFENGGVYRVIREDKPVVTGEYRVAGDTLLLVDKSGTMACSITMGAAGTYLWKSEVDGGLSLSAVQDPCVGRRKITTLRVLTPAGKE